MDKETAFSMGLAAASFMPGPVGLVARGALMSSMAYAGWQHRDAIADVTRKAIGISPAAAETALDKRYNDISNRSPPVWNGIEVRGPHDGPRAKKAKTNTESAATPVAPMTAPQAVMPPSQAAPAPSVPVITMAVESKSAAEKEFDAALKNFERAQKAFDEEINGTGGSRKRSEGPISSQRQRELDKARDALTEARKAVEADKKEQHKIDSGNKTLWGLLAAGAAGLIGYKIAGLAGSRAATGVVERMMNLNTLGRAAAALNKSKGVLTGTPKGDALKGIVAAARSSKEQVAMSSAHVAATGSRLSGIAYGVAGEGVITTAASYNVLPGIDIPEEQRAALRVLGYGSLGLAAGMKIGAGVALANSIPAVRAGSASALKTAERRLTREASGGAMKASKHRVGAAVVNAEKELIRAKAGTAIGSIKGKQSIAAAAQVAPGKRHALTKAAQKAEAKARANAAARAVATRESKRKLAIQGAYQLGRNKGAQEVVGNRALALQGGKGWSDWARYQAAVKQGHRWKGPVPKRPEGRAPKRMAPPRLAAAA